MRRLIPLSLILFFAASAWAQALETITLRHRNADQILPQVQPFVGPGGVVTGVNDTLFVRASAANLAEIRKLVASLDVPVRRLMISVRQGSDETTESAGAGVAGRVGVGDGKPSVDARVSVYRSDRMGRRDGTQQVQTVDGGRAAIMSGQSMLIPMRQVVMTPTGAIVSQTWVQRDLGTGFVAVPRLNGDLVTLEISPMDDTPGPVPGSVNVRRLTTTVSGRLGEWIDLGGTAGEESAREDGIARYGTRSASRQRRLLLKVDELQ